MLLASAFFLHLFPGTPSSGNALPNTTSNSALNGSSDKDMLRIATADSGIIATVSFSPDEAVTRIQVENTGSAQLKHVKVMAGGEKVLGVLSQLSPDEKKVLAVSGSLKGVKVTALDPSGSTISGEVCYTKPTAPKIDFGAFSGGSSGGGSSSPPENVKLSTQAVQERPKQESKVSNDTSQDHASNITQNTAPRFNITITTNRSDGSEGEAVQYNCKAVNCGEDTLSDVKLFCMDKTTATTYLTPGNEITINGTLSINESMNISAGVQGKDTSAKIWTSNASVKIWKISPQIGLEVIAPAKVHRGESLNLTVKLNNAGGEELKNLTISDAFGQIGTIPILKPGEPQILQRNCSLEKSIADDVRVMGFDAAGRSVYAFKGIDLDIYSSGLEISAEPSETVSYPGQPVDVTWILTNSGEEPLKNVTLSGDGNRCRLRELSPNSSVRIAGVYTKNCTSIINMTAEGRDYKGYLISKRGSVLIKTISPGIGLKVMPPEIEACKGETVNLSCLVTNVGDDVLTGVVLRLGGEALETIDSLAPGEFKLITPRLTIASNDTFGFSAEGKDSRGRTWSDSTSVNASIITSALRASVCASPQLVNPGESTEITCTVTNTGSIALYNIFAISKVFGPLGTIDYLAPKGQRHIKAEKTVNNETDDLISVDAFTFEKQPLHTSCRLHIAVTKLPAQINVPKPIIARTPAASILDLESAPEENPVPDVPQRSMIKASLNHTATNSGNDILGGVEGLIRYIQRMIGQAGIKTEAGGHPEGYESKEVSSNDISSAPDISENTSISKNYELGIESVKGSEHGAIRILDVSASPSQPAAGEPVKISVHAKSSSGIRSAKAHWGISDTPLTKQDMMEVDRVHSMPMTIESGDSNDGYWSCTIPGKAAGSYMVISLKLTDGTTDAEEGPFMLHWSTVNSVQKSGNYHASGSSGKGMLFIESSVVSGKGDVSIKDNFDDSAVKFNEKMKGNGSINMESLRSIDKSYPGTNFSEKKDLVFTGGQLKGTKTLESPTFQGGMGASVTERYNLSHVDKSDTDTVSSANHTYNKLAFNTDQAFEGNWNIQTRYAQFYKKMKADQQYTGSFQTQKKIEFQDNGQGSE